jgi:uncharacterized protein (TIGR01777 family)
VKIVIPGGSGQLGRRLLDSFAEDGHDVVILTRAAEAASPVRAVPWDGKTLAAWAEELDGADVLINLAGRSVNCRYNARNRREIMDSRVESTRVLGQAVAAASSPPRTWLHASTATIYAHRYDAPNDERTGILGGDEPGVPETWRFSIDVAKAWEAELDAADTPRTRKVAMRTAMVMSPDRGGVFDVLLGLVRRGLGGKVGDGRQFISWLHHDDFLGAVRWLIEHDDLSGALNLASPNPLPQAEFMRVLRKAWGMPVGLPATRWMLEIGTFFTRTESELILKSRRVVPGRLLESGYEFSFPAWPEAAGDLVHRWRLLRRGNRARGG